MPPAALDFVQDVLQVCRNGHVVTDQMRTCPERSRSHCDRCGATTLFACSTCGQELAGAVVVPGLQPIGASRPPLFCATCGAAFPWHRPRRRGAATPAARTLEAMLRRLPCTVRQLRQRWGTRPAFCLEDEHDLEDLVRSLLPLSFDAVQLRSRTPFYAPGTRIDFLLPTEGIVLTLKRTSRELRQTIVEAQLKEDVDHYRSVRQCRALWVYIFDPQGYLPAPRELEVCWSRQDEAPRLRCLIAG